MTFAFGEIVTIIRDSAIGFDPFGNPLATSTIRTDVIGCAVAPRYSSEPTENARHGVVIGLSLFAPDGTNILSTDRIEVGGGGTVSGVAVTPTTAKVYLVDGAPGVWANAFTGTRFGIEVALKIGLG